MVQALFGEQCNQSLLVKGFKLYSKQLQSIGAAHVVIEFAPDSFTVTPHCHGRSIPYRPKLMLVLVLGSGSGAFQRLGALQRPGALQELCMVMIRSV